jgi:hypothetical protein
MHWPCAEIKNKTNKKKELEMKKYIALHTYKTTPEQTWKLLGEVANDLALAMDEGKTPARCLKTWNPFPHGRRDLAFCLWEAEKPEDIITTLGALMNHITADLLPVDEIDWAELTLAARAEAAKVAA